MDSLFKIDETGPNGLLNGLSASPAFTRILTVENDGQSANLLITDKPYADLSLYKDYFVLALKAKGLDNASAIATVEGWLRSRNTPCYGKFVVNQATRLPCFVIARRVDGVTSADQGIQRFADLISTVVGDSKAVDRYVDFVNFARLEGVPADRSKLQTDVLAYFNARGCNARMVQLVPANEGSYTTVAALYAGEPNLHATSTNGNWSHVIEGGAAHWGTSFTMLYYTMSSDGRCVAIPNDWFGYNMTALSSGGSYGNPAFITAVNAKLVTPLNTTGTGFLSITTSAGDQSPSRWWGGTIFAAFNKMKTALFNSANTLYVLGCPAALDFAHFSFNGYEAMANASVQINGVITSVPRTRVITYQSAEAFSLGIGLASSKAELSSEMSAFLANYPYACAIRVTHRNPFVYSGDEVLKRTQLYAKAMDGGLDIFNEQLATGISFKMADNKAKAAAGRKSLFYVSTGKVEKAVEDISRDAALYGTWLASADGSLSGSYGSSTFVLSVDDDYDTIVYILKFGVVNCGALSQSAFLADLVARRGAAGDYVDVTEHELRIDVLAPFGYLSSVLSDDDKLARFCLVGYGTTTNDIQSFVAAQRVGWNLTGLIT